MRRYEIKHRDTGVILFAGEYDDMRECVVAAAHSRANLDGANLADANLADANLTRAYLARAYLARANLGCAYLGGATIREGITVNALVRRATRSDGHEFFLWGTSAGWRITAGCRFFTFEEAWMHWYATRGNTPLGHESLDILTFFSLHMDRQEDAPC